jgi:hypothetical protein
VPETLLWQSAKCFNNRFVLLRCFYTFGRRYFSFRWNVFLEENIAANQKGIDSDQSHAAADAFSSV